MDNKGDLYIPISVKKRKEFLGIDGIGGKEAIGVGISIGVGLVIGLILFFISSMNPFFLFMPIFIFGSAGYIFLRKDKTNRNSIDKVKLLIDFMKSQKRFYYKYYNIYEGNREGSHVKKENRSGINGQ